MRFRYPWIPVLLTMTVAAAPGAMAADETIQVKNVDEIVRKNPLPRGQNATFADTIRAGSVEMAVLVMSKNPLHHHKGQDHVLYVVSGHGTARLENPDGRVATRTVKPGDILALPRGRKHGFEKLGSDDLVFLIVSTPLAPGVEETTYED